MVFVSQANNLVTNDGLSLNLDVFVRDRVAATTTLVSVNTSGIGGGNADANHPTISSNGQFVVFESRASNFVAGDTNGFADIFVRDLAGSTTRLVSEAADGGGANGPSWNAMISGDGRRVFFESRASNLVAQAAVGTNIFVRDLWSNTTALVTVSADGLSGGNAPAELRQVSDDGRFALFLSAATNFLVTPTPGNPEVFLRDVEAGQTWWTSQRYRPYAMNRCTDPVMSPDGAWVAYYAKGYSPYAIRWHRPSDSARDTWLASSTNVGPLGISADGQSLFYQGATSYAISNHQIWLWDTTAPSNSVVTNGLHLVISVVTNGTNAANGVSQLPQISRDGSKVLFVSTGNNLATNALGLFTNQLYLRDRSNNVTHLVSVGPDGAALNDELSFYYPALSADGNLVAFESLAADLVPGDVNNAVDIFVRDVNAGTTELISAAHPARVAHTGAALCLLPPSAVSADGRYVLFFSRDNVLSPPPTNWVCSLFLTDLTGGATLPIVSAATDAANPAQLARDELSRAAESTLSADGRYVALVRRVWDGFYYSSERMVCFDRVTGLQSVVSLSAGTNPVPAGTGHTSPEFSADGRLVVWQCRAGILVAQPPVVNSSLFAVFLRDLQTGTNQLISINSAGANTGNSDSTSPRLSPDTHRVVFQSRATDLTPGVLSTATYKLFARDLPMQTTRLLSVDETGATIESESSGGLSFSGDGRFAAFHTTNTARIFRHEFASEARTNLLVASNALNPSLSFDGRLVACETRRGGATVNDVFVKDLQSGTEELISVNRTGTGGGDGSSFAPVIGAYGRYVVFASKAGNLVDNDTNGFTDIFVRDRWTTNTLLVSVSRAGVAGNAVSGRPMLAADGRTVVFESFSGDLADGDFNDKRDVFVVKLGLPDTDGDNMDDDWEVAFFGTLARDGAGDLDGDGTSDAQEFRAGTDPTNLGSVLRVLTVSAAGGGPTTLQWSAVPGRHYRVQFKESLVDAGWSEFPADIVAQFHSASFIDVSAPGTSRRFYRVVVP